MIIWRWQHLLICFGLAVVPIGIGLILSNELLRRLKWALLYLVLIGSAGFLVSLFALCGLDPSRNPYSITGGMILAFQFLAPVFFAAYVHGGFAKRVLKSGDEPTMGFGRFLLGSIFITCLGVCMVEAWYVSLRGGVELLVGIAIFALALWPLSRMEWASFDRATVGQKVIRVAITTALVIGACLLWVVVTESLRVPATPLKEVF